MLLTRRKSSSMTAKLAPWVKPLWAPGSAVRTGYTSSQYIRKTSSAPISAIGCIAYVTEMNHGVALPTPSGTLVS
mgnify:CR=1 FL=1